MWLVNSYKVLEKMSKYIKEATLELPTPALPDLPPVTLRTTYKFCAKWSNLQLKLQNLQNQLSSLSQRQFDLIKCCLQSLLNVSNIT
jgi:hypothetical protein